MEEVRLKKPSFQPGSAASNVSGNRKSPGDRHLPVSLGLAVFCSLAGVPNARGEVVLEYFNTSWKEIERRVPELAEAGYTALWLPPPAKAGSGSYSVGYDPLDRFDLGDKNQSGSVPTRYGTKADLLRLVKVAHRFGLRIYFDNVMAHNAGPLADVAPGTLFPGIPGFVPEDFHLVKKTGGGWRKASDSVNYNDEWQVLNRNPFAWDIAQENPNTSFDPTGQTENLDYPKWTGIRHPGQTALYTDLDLPGVTDANGVVFRPFADKEPYVDSNNNGRFDWTDTNSNGQHDVGEASEAFTDTGVDPSVPGRQTAAWGYGDGRYNMGDPVAEDVNGMLIRSICWTIDQTGCDGFRLDAVKHVPGYFFGQQNGTKDPASTGFLGRAQAQFNLTHGYADWSNHRNSTFSTDAVRDDLMLFGEHLGAPPDPNDYLASGMRIANDNFANNVGGYNGIGSNMSGFDAPGAFTFGTGGGMMYCLSHDNNYMANSERAAAHQYMLTREGLPIVYTDGYNVAGGPSYFPKPAYIPFLGQYDQKYVTGSLAVRQEFVRGEQVPKWSSQNFCAWEFRDFSENASMPAVDATTVVVMHARNYVGGQQMPFGTTFPAGARLRNYSQFNGSFYVTVGNDGRLRGDGDANPVIVPSGGYFAFSYDVPRMPIVWNGSPTVHLIDIFENGVAAPTIGVQRKDGANGDAGYTHIEQIPLVRDGTNLRITARADGSTANILMRLDNGIDLNAQMGGTFTAGRDNPPGTARDTFLGYERMRFVHRVVEKFAARNIVAQSRDIIGSGGAENWQCTIGTAGFTRVDGNGTSTDTDTADWIYHNPEGTDINGTSDPQFSPAPAAAAGQAITVWTKLGYKSSGITNGWVYYTTDGSSPEGSAGAGAGTTKTIPIAYDRDGNVDGTGTQAWWKGTIPALPANTVLRYKIGVYKSNASNIFPSSANAITLKQRTDTLFEVANFNATTATVYPNGDLTKRETGLEEGFHLLTSRNFLSRSGKASLFQTNTQTFYYDAQRPTGTVLFPTQNGTLGGTTYGAVVLTDASVTGVQFNVLDTNAGNDSPANGNGVGNWAAATEVTPTQTDGTAYVREWRFDYKNIPASGSAVINVRLREASSSSNNSLDDASGWFTSLVRNVNTGSAVNYRIQYPTTDGTVVGPNYVAKVYFNKSLANGIPAQQMVDEFTISLDGQLIPRSGCVFIPNETGTESAMSFHFPNSYTGNPDDLHELRAVHQRADISLADTRLVKSAPGAIMDSDGDGLPDYWETANGLDPNNPDGIEGGDGDVDDDGLSNLAEFLADFNPADPNDGHLLTPVITPVGNIWRLQFPVIPNRLYQIEGAAAPGGWAPLGNAFTVTTANPAYQWTAPAPGGPQQFYRVRISLP